MREAFISILALLAVAVPTKCSEIGKDGFNFYKDYLRGRSDDVGDEGPLEDRVLYKCCVQNANFVLTEKVDSPNCEACGVKENVYLLVECIHNFYRTPLPLYPSMLPAALEQEYKKRTGNAFKNHMLSKESWNGAPNKRSSKTALSFLMQGKHPYFANEGRSCPYGK